MHHIKLKNARKGVGLTVTEIAKKLNMTAPAYRRYERGEVDPRISQCIEIVEMIGCKLDDIWGTEESPRSVDVSYRAKPGQTVYVKIETAGEEQYITPIKVRPKRESKTKRKVVNGN